MLRITALVAALCSTFIFGSTASATVSVNLVASGGYTPGSLITLTTFATSDGGETSLAVFGTINFNDALVNSNVGLNSQVNLSTIGDALPGWTSNGLICTSAKCTAFSQTHSLPAVTAGITNVPISTVVFTIDPSVTAGTVINFAWRTTPSTNDLNWFGITNAPGVSITVIPEPSTAALLSVGLLGVAVSVRRADRTWPVACRERLFKKVSRRRR